MSTVDLKEWFDIAPFKGSSVIDVPEGWVLKEAASCFVTPFMAVVTVTYQVPDRKDLDTKEIILRRPAPVVLAIRPGKAGFEILLIQLDRHGEGGAIWELPGGMNSKGESDQETAARELLEEGGVEVDPNDLQLLGKVVRDPARSPGLYAPVYYAQVSREATSALPIVEPGEYVVDRRWCTTASIEAWLVNGGRFDGTLLAALTLARANRLFG